MRAPARSAAALLVALWAASVGAPAATARGNGGTPVVVQHLLERGYELLRKAESAHFAKERETARSLGREAERVFEDVLAQEPRDARAALLGGQAAALSGDLGAANRWIGRLARIAPGQERSPDLHYLRAFVALIASDHPLGAVRALQQMYSLDPGARPLERDNLWFLALAEQGRRLMEAEKYREAITQFRTGARVARRLGSQPKEMMMLGNVGIALQRDLRFIEALEVFEALGAQDPENPLWYWQQGLCLASQSLFVDAAKKYREVIRLREAGHTVPSMEKELRMVHLRMGNCMRHLADRQKDPEKRKVFLDEAVLEIGRYIQAAPEDPLGHKWMGVLLFENLERPYDALPYLHKAFAMDPECADSLKFIIQIHEHYPPPEGTTIEAWKAPLAAWKKDVEEGAERREKILEEREKRTGSSGCN